MKSHVKRSFLTVLLATLSSVLLLGGTCPPPVELTNCPTDDVELGSSFDLQIEVSGGNAGDVTTSTTAENADVDDENSLTPSITPRETGPVTVVVVATDSAGNTADDTCAFDAICTADGQCDDDDPCTVDECINMNCEHADADCSALDDPCNAGGCDAETGICLAQATNENGLCDDGNACTTGDTCVDGICAGESIICPEGQQCAEGKCIQCPPGSNCIVLDDECNVGVRNPDTNSCEKEAKDDGTLCDDGDACTFNDTCEAGTCVAGPPLNCNDGDACTDDDCDTNDGCTHTPIVCQGGLVCDPNTGACVCDDDTDCDDDNTCTDDSCDSDTGCVFTANDHPCDDLEACTDNDICSAGVCAGTVMDCPSGQTCMDGSCVLDPTSGVPQRSDCGGNAIECTGGDPVPGIDVDDTHSNTQSVQILEWDPICRDGGFADLVPHKILVTGIGTNGFEEVQLTGLCNACPSSAPPELCESGQLEGCGNDCAGDFLCEDSACNEGPDVGCDGQDCFDCRDAEGCEVDTGCYRWTQDGTPFAETQGGPLVAMADGDHVVRYEVATFLDVSTEALIIVNPESARVIAGATPSALGNCDRPPNEFDYAPFGDTTLCGKAFGGAEPYTFAWEVPDCLGTLDPPDGENAQASTAQNPTLTIFANCSDPADNVATLTVTDGSGNTDTSRVIFELDCG